MKAEGYIVTFSVPGRGSVVFAPGCLKNTNPNRHLNNVPILRKLTNFGTDSVIGYAKLTQTHCGIYAVCEFDEKKLDLPQDRIKSFGFYANHIDKNDKKYGKEVITGMNICAISFEPDECDTSSIKFYKED